MTDRMEMAYMLVRIFLGKGKVEGLLSMLFTLEAKKSTPQTLFRGKFGLQWVGNRVIYSLLLYRNYT